ncbi:MAG: hypothetical protein LBH60_01745, partial [Prevotellaceae bacterium]|nr:hypothetical protein [Prevotellaceae bacterium]
FTLLTEPVDRLFLGNTLTGVKNVQLGVIENYAENPILLDTVYHIAGKNIGYFVYNFFARDRGNGNLAYEIELNDLFYDFKSKHLDELIVDLRYNGGGAVVTASVLAEMISGRPASDVFYQQEYNSFLNEYLRTNIPNYTNKSYFLNKIESSDGRTSIPVNSLSNLSTVYFIVSGRSASASELLINGLKPYMNVVLIGEKTYGKNVASITIYEEDPVKQRTNKWGMQPIIMKMSNAQGFSEYGEGFVPDVRAFEFSGQDFDIKQLGDTDELLLKAAINTVSGIKTPTAVTKRTGRQFELVGSAVDRTPARRNQYISLENMELTGK